MVENIKKTDNNTKTQLALAAALFFSPLVQYILKTGNRNLNEQEKSFIKGYIRFGYFTLSFGAITIVSGILQYTLVLNIFNIIYMISSGILLALLVISMISILSDISLMKGKDSIARNYSIQGNKKYVLLKYLPLYNIYLWYQNPNFEKPNRWVKESLLLWILFILCAIFGSNIGSVIILILIIIRVASLMSDIDILSTKSKQQLNKLFLKNPEELRGYVLGSLSYLGKYIAGIISPLPKKSLTDEIQTYKNQYSSILPIKNNSYLILEYILGLLFTIGIFYFIIPDFTVRTYYAGFGLLVLRYVSMAIQLKYLPHLPIAREITILIKKFIQLFQKKPFIINK